MEFLLKHSAGRAIAVLVMCATVVVGCGGDDEEGAGPAGRDTETLTVSVIPVTYSAPLFLGQERGFFEEEGLELDVQFAQGGAAIVPAVQSGEVDIGFGNMTSLILSQSQGLPIKIIANSESAVDSLEKCTNAVIVPENSPIRDAQGLEGQTVASNTLDNIVTVTVREGANKLGADGSSIEFVEVPFPEMLAALEGGDIDAAAITEPFLTLATHDGDARQIFCNFSQTQPGLLIDVYFASEQFLADNADVAARFGRAMRRSNEYAADNPDDVRAIIPEYTEIPPEVSEDITLPVWSGEPVDREDLELMGELMVEQGLIEEAPSIDSLVQE